MLLNWLLPHASRIAQHPVYQMEVRQIPKRALPRLITYSLFWIARVTAVVLVLWLVYIFLILRPLNIPYYYSLASAIWESYSIFLVATIGASILLDLTSVLVSVNSITGDKLTGRWDFILVADMHPLNTIRAKHSAAQIRAWRGMIILMGLRFASIVIGILQIFLITMWIDKMTVFQTIEDIISTIFQAPFEFVVILIIFATYTIEPLWRMQTVTAITLAISARGWRFTMALLASFAGVVGMWISQVLLVGFVFWMTTLLLPDYMENNFFWRIFVPIYVLAFATMIYGYYRFVRLWSLRRAAAIAFRT